MNDLISRHWCLAEYDKRHQGPPGGARKIIEEAPTVQERKIGRWIKDPKAENCLTPGGTPYYVCDQCGGSGHLHGIEFPRRKVFCDQCGSVNVYYWEQTIEEIEQKSEEEPI